MYSFDELWTLLQPKRDYDQLKAKWLTLWNSFSPDKQQFIYLRIEQKKNRKEFVDYNPLWAIEKNNVAPRKQILSMDEYFKRYDTTAETDGWKMVNPTGNQVIYVKQ